MSQLIVDQSGRSLSIALSQDVDSLLRRHLLATPGAEDLTFALYNPSDGSARTSALIHRIILPEEGDRQQHGNVSFNLQYFERVLDIAAAEGCGVAFLHSHLGPGWQGMSSDDVVAEKRLAGPSFTVTDLPLVGLTLATDGTWSARYWVPGSGRNFERLWCATVRVVGVGLTVSYDSQQMPPSAFREMFKRTRTVWGDERHSNVSRLQVGIVGLGSVGMSIAEGLARSGLQRITLIDFDEVQSHNLDRLQGASIGDIDRLKVIVARGLVERSATAKSVLVTEVPFSVVEREGYEAALDCDVIFSCVDRPRARQLLNHIAFAHLIPVIDGGIAVRFREGEFAGAEWQVQTVAPGRPCLECLGAFSADDADTERAGMLEDPSYMRGLPQDHHLKQNENVYPFAMNLASLELFHFIALAAGVPRFSSVGVQRFHLVAGMLETDDTVECKPSCDVHALVASGDRHFTYVGRDRGADKARARQNEKGRAHESP